MYINRLNKGLIESLPDGLHADGGNLYLKKRGTARSWIFRYKLNYKTFELGLGSAYVIPLAEARKKALNLRHDIVNGIYPSTRIAKERKAKEEARRVAIGDTITLGDILEPALRHNFELKRMRKANYVEANLGSVRKHYSALCAMPISLITKETIAEAIKKNMHTSTVAKHITVFRLCFDYAKMKGYFSGENPADKRNGLNMYVPPSVGAAHKHFNSVDWRELPELYAKMEARKPSRARDILRVVILTACRLSEVGKFRKETTDLERMIAVCSTTKTSLEPVQFPLPRQCKAIMSSPSYVWAPINSHSGLYLLEKLGYPGMTVHGFRASFSTWCAENGKDPEMRERCLGHAVDTKVAACYQRSDLLERRRALIQEWADYVTSGIPKSSSPAG